MVDPGSIELKGGGEEIVRVGILLSIERGRDSDKTSAGVLSGVRLAVSTDALNGEDDFTKQLFVDDPSFPAVSRAVTRIMNVPDTSVGTLREYVPDVTRFRVTVIQVFPLSFEYAISTPATATLSLALHATVTEEPGAIEL
jgi:hypothetical protein